MTTIDDLLPQLSRAKIVTVCDGFWHVPLDAHNIQNPSRPIPLVENAIWHLTSTRDFQRQLNQALEGLKGVYIIAGDILVTGEGPNLTNAEADHDRNIIQLLNRCKAKGIKLNKTKLRLRQSEVTYMPAEGLKPDPSKVQAIIDMPRPQTVEGVQRLVGTINYLARYLPNFSHMSEPLRQITRRGIEWQSTDHHKKALQNIKAAITKGSTSTRHPLQFSDAMPPTPA